MKKYRTWSEINLKTLSDNVRHLRTLVCPEVNPVRSNGAFGAMPPPPAVRTSNGVKILVVVKADAYGHGAVPVGRTALESGADMLGVGDSSEAIELRQSGILEPILILGAVIEEEISWMVSYNITPTIHSMDLLELFNDEAKRQNKLFSVHLKIDSGMSRLGSTPKRALEIARKLPALSHLKLEGISSHLSCSSDHKEKSFTEKQVGLFRQTVEEIENSLGLKIPLKHIANTGAILCHPDALFTMVRAGGIVYGIDPGNLREITNAGKRISFNPILSLKSQITFLKIVPTGTAVSYGKNYITKRRTKIATIPIGYNDGYPYHLSNKGQVIIHCKKAPIIGAVTMDYIMVDVTDIHPSASCGSHVKVGDEVILIGSQDQSTKIPPEAKQSNVESILVEDLARLCEVSPYVITCGLGKRVKRMYIN
ncbi:MAG: alanine racemase [Planctomycetota bacterium]|nr:alanine racemase [Planctomycetota bacterium]MDI6787465.1 alanine racemase [Planctomycetota bacterium]